MANRALTGKPFCPILLSGAGDANLAGRPPLPWPD